MNPKNSDFKGIQSNLIKWNILVHSDSTQNIEVLFRNLTSTCLQQVCAMSLPHCVHFTHPTSFTLSCQGCQGTPESLEDHQVQLSLAEKQASYLPFGIHTVPIILFTSDLIDFRQCCWNASSFFLSFLFLETFFLIPSWLLITFFSNRKKYCPPYFVLCVLPGLGLPRDGSVATPWGVQWVCPV